MGMAYVKPEPYEEVAYTEYRITCPYVGCDFQTRHRGGKQRDIALRLFYEHEHGTQVR